MRQTEAEALRQTEAEALRGEFDVFEQQILERENAIAECMVSQGFEYVAELPADWLAERSAFRLAYSGSGDGEVVGCFDSPNGSDPDPDPDPYVG